jgi:hypothetical protein
VEDQVGATMGEGGVDCLLGGWRDDRRGGGYDRRGGGMAIEMRGGAEGGEEGNRGGRVVGGGVLVELGRGAW